MKANKTSAIYSKTSLDTYDKERHIPLEAAYDLIKSQKDKNLPLEKLVNAINKKNITVHQFNNAQYLDRLDIGRVYHESKKGEGIEIKRYFTDGKIDPFDTVGPYTERAVTITDNKGRTVFHMDDALFPESWGDNDVTIVAHRYLFKPRKPEWQEKIQEKIGKPYEQSITHLITRVTNFIADEGEKLGYFKTSTDKEAFKDELKWLQINRKMAFNSPVQFNAGIYNEYGIAGSGGKQYWRDSQTGEVQIITKGSWIKPQSHACFITGPHDDIESIAEHHKNEAMIFKSGSGVGQGIDRLRGEGEPLSSGGVSSGSMSFLVSYDHAAGTIKSGGKTRRAARMTTTRYHHPDSLEFIRRKVREDHKALILMQNGYSGGMDGEAYTTVALQNTNLSIRLDDYFFDQVEKDGIVEFHQVTDGKVVGKIAARRMLQEIAFGTWRIGDPGVQYESKTQEMHTAKNSGNINSSNPCSEYMFIDDTACNLASLNLLRFSDQNGNFDYQSFKHGSKITGIALDIINDVSSYPVKDIAAISPEFRNVGLGYANIGALLMRKGVAYDSDEGRAFAGAVTALMTGAVYEESTELAKARGTFTHYEFNRKPMREVIKKHQKNLDEIQWEHIDPALKDEVYHTWNKVVNNGRRYGFRNGQASVIAPTGTISFLMGCDTTGIEPSYSLSIFKNLAGGGTLTLVNNEVPNALHNLRYTEAQISEINKYITEEIRPRVARSTVVGAPHMNPEHYKIFETATGNVDGLGAMPFEGHVRMLAAAQPFISGAISKTSNFPKSATVKNIYDAYLLSYKLGLKAIAIFRDDSKPISALSFGDKRMIALKRGEKEDLPPDRPGHEYEVKIGGTKFHFITGEYPDGRIGQIVIESYKGGSTLGAMLRQAGIQASASLKRGVELEDVLKGWIGDEFEPKGLVFDHSYIKTALSPLDFAGKLLRLEYLGDVDIANDPSTVDINKLRGTKNGAIQTYARRHINDWNFEEVINDSIFGGFVTGTKENTNGTNGKKSNGFKKSELTNDRGVMCNECGSAMDRTTPNCYSCPGCGNKNGGCGL
ncbi:MAG: vitamin B12-dependent ribonucleotide reductase [Candidatus Woesearchaeota archaeon]